LLFQRSAFQLIGEKPSLMLFDKLIEERETQAAGSLRIMVSFGWSDHETLAKTAFHTITKTSRSG
jgi:hypothetical protein